MDEPEPNGRAIPLIGMTDDKRPQVPAAYHRSEVRFAQALHGKGVVADAFRRLCEKGCDPKWLQFNVFKLSRYPQQKVEKLYNAKDFLKLKAIAAKVKKAADELMPFEDLLVQETFGGANLLREFLDWERPTQIPNTLRHLSDRLNQCSEWAKSSPNPFPTVFDGIPVIVAYVRTTTGRPYFSEVAILIGAALRDSKFNAEQLKMICARRKSKTKK